MRRDSILALGAMASLCALGPSRPMEIRLGPDIGDWPTDPIRGGMTISLGGRTTPPSNRKTLLLERARRRQERACR